MVFMGADHIEGNVDLDQAADDDIEEIRSIGASATVGDRRAGAPTTVAW